MPKNVILAASLPAAPDKLFDMYLDAESLKKQVKTTYSWDDKLGIYKMANPFWKEFYQGAMKQAKTYLREIVPKFNLLAYYRFGAPFAKGIMYFLYRPVVERTLLRVFNDRAPKGSVVVYVINHRSNADYVLVAHMLFEFISLSYAVGEWARVWPLNHLFKWFGAYFIRRTTRGASGTDGEALRPDVIHESPRGVAARTGDLWFRLLQGLAR